MGLHERRASDPVVRFVLCLVSDENAQALRGEAAVVVGDETVWQQQLAPADLEGHVSFAVGELHRSALQALEVASASKPDADPPPQRRPKRRTGQPQPKPTANRGVSRSRRL